MLFTLINAEKLKNVVLKYHNQALYYINIENELIILFSVVLKYMLTFIIYL